MFCVPHVLIACTLCVSVGQSWTRYEHKETCALKGSSVELACSYTNPTKIEVLKAFWSKQWQPPMKPVDLNLVLEYSGHMEYLNRGANDCTLTLKRPARERERLSLLLLYMLFQVFGKCHKRKH